MPELKFELKPEFHESYIGHFDIMTEKNFTRISKNAGMQGFDVKFKADGTAESIKLDGREVTIEELRQDGRFYDNLRDRMNPTELAKFDAQVKEAAGKKVYRTGEQIEASRKASEKPANLEKVRELYPGLDSNPASQSKFNEALTKLAGNVAKYGFLAGLTALGLYEIGQANKGCYLVNAETGEKLGKRLDGSTDSSQCRCATHNDVCSTFCKSRTSPDAPQQNWYNKDTCDLDCACLQKPTTSNPVYYQPPKNNAQFQVVEGGVWSTFSNILGSVGYEVNRFVNDAMDIVDSAAKGIGNLFSKWWVILIIVGVGLVIILVPTLVTQLPKAKAKGISGGRFRHQPLTAYPYF